MPFVPNDHKAFFADLAENGYHILSRQHARTPGFYPNPFPTFPELAITDLKEGDRITIRAFFPADISTRPKIDSGLIDIEVESVDQEAKTLIGGILTELPASFALARGTSIELNLDEVLEIQEHL